MKRVRAPEVHVLVTIGLGAVVVATPVPINFAALLLWAWLVARWVRRQARTRGPRVGAAELALQLAVMCGLVLAVIAAPCKVVDRVKARRITLPRPTLTVADLGEPETFERVPLLRHSFGEPPADLAGWVVRFPSRDLTVGQFIGAIEAQTPLRHRFGHCGNGWTILRGGDCSFGLSFRVPSP